MSAYEQTLRLDEGSQGRCESGNVADRTKFVCELIILPPEYFNSAAWNLSPIPKGHGQAVLCAPWKGDWSAEYR